MRNGAAAPGPLPAGVDGLAEVAADELAGGAALAVLEALGAPPDAAPLEAAPEEAELPLSLGGRTATPPPLPLDGAAAVEPPFAAEPPAGAEPLPAVPFVEPPLAACADEPAALLAPLVDDGVDDVEGDVVEDEAAGGAELCVVALCAGGVLVRVLCPTGKNDPPVMSVAMMPAITATRAIPISRSGQLRLSQSMVPF